jgi:hypothetical protein
VTKPTSSTASKAKDIESATPSNELVSKSHVTLDAEAVIKKATDEPNPPTITAAPTSPSKEEAAAAKVSDKDIKSYWRAREAERKTPRGKSRRDPRTASKMPS